MAQISAACGLLFATIQNKNGWKVQAGNLHHAFVAFLVDEPDWLSFLHTFIFHPAVALQFQHATLVLPKQWLFPRNRRSIFFVGSSTNQSMAGNHSGATFVGWRFCSRFVQHLPGRHRTKSLKQLVVVSFGAGWLRLVGEALRFGLLHGRGGLVPAAPLGLPPRIRPQACHAKNQGMRNSQDDPPRSLVFLSVVSLYSDTLQVDRRCQETQPRHQDENRLAMRVRR